MVSRYRGLSRTAARLTLAALAMLMGYGVFIVARPAPAEPTRVHASHDADLYRAVVARMLKGEGYYPAAATEQRARGYPMRPFLTMRPPLLAEVSAVTGGAAAMGWLLRAVLLATALALLWRLWSSTTHGVTQLATMLAGVFALALLAQPSLAIWHEVWAAVLVTLALALYHPQRWGPSLIVAIIAGLTRELAIPFLVVMGFMAATERRWREVIGWVLGLALVGAMLVVHAQHADAMVLPGDGRSPGWAHFGGWRLVLTFIGQTSALILLPALLNALLVPLALLGWLGWRDGLGARGALWIGGMMLAFMLFGRADNFYWGMLIAPLLLLGLALAPRALADLAQAAR